MADPRRLPTFQTRLTLSLFGVVLALTAALMVGLVYSSARLVRRTVGTIINAHLNHNQALIAGYFGAAQTQLFAAEHWAAAGLLTASDTSAAAGLLMPLCDSTVQISGAYLTDGNGNSLTLSRSHEGWQSASVRNNSAGVATFTVWPEPHNLPGRTWQGQAPPMGTTQLWCDTAVRAGSSVVWSGLVEDGPAGPGVLVAKKLQSPGAAPLVLTFEISLWDLDALLDRLHPTPNGYALLVDSQSGLLERNPPAGREELEEELEPPAVLELKQTLLSKALTLLPIEAEKPRTGLGFPPAQTGARRTSSIQSFKLAHERWWAGLTPLDLQGTVWGSTGTRDIRGAANLYIVTLVPESDLFSELRNQRLLLLTIASSVLLLALVLGSRVARTISAPVAALVEESERIQRLDLTGVSTMPKAPVREIAQLAAAQESMRQALDSFARYVPVPLVRELLSRGEAAQIGGRTATLTILISDIRGFTALTELLPPEELARQLAEYFECLLGVLNAGGATIDKMVGDSVICFWGAPHPDEQQAQHAVAAAMAAVRALEDLNGNWIREGKPPLITKFGLAQGEVVVGNIGSRWRLNYTALGDAVNLASRLQQLAPRYDTPIVASDSVRRNAPQYVWRQLERVDIRGRRMHEDVHEPLGLVADVDADQVNYARSFERALELLWSNQRPAAMAVVDELMTLRQGDAALEILRHALTGR